MIPECFIKEAVYLPKTGSTNDEALSRIAAGSENCLVWTLCQTGGRGSRGRGWMTPPDHGLAVSIGLRGETVPDPRTFCYPLFTGILLHHAILAGREAPVNFLPLRLKWPNDLLFQGRKLAGILCESRWSGKARSLVLGMGLNLKPHPDMQRLPKGFACLSELPLTQSPETLLVSLRAALPELLAALSDWETLNREWLRRCQHSLGSQLSLVTEGERLQGVFLGLDQEGSFLIKARDGGRRVIRQTCEDFRILEAG